MKLTRFTFYLVIILLFASCGSAPKQAQSNHYYVLENSHLPANQDSNSQKQKVLLKPIVVPAYLKQTRLVTKGAQSEMQYANYHHWAEAPNRAIYAALLDKLNAKNNQFYVPHCRTCDQITVTIRKFYPTTTGEVLLTGFYTQSNAEHAVIKQQAFDLVEPLSQGGFDESVQKMDVLLSRLVDEISQH